MCWPWGDAGRPGAPWHGVPVRPWAVLQRGVSPALTFQDGHVDLRQGLVLGVGEALVGRLTAADAAGPWGQPLLGTASLLLPRGPGEGRKQSATGSYGWGPGPFAVPGLPRPPLRNAPAPGSPHLAAWCGDGASSGSVCRRRSGSGLGLVWLPAGEGSSRQESSRTPSAQSPSMLRQCPVRCKGWLRGVARPGRARSCRDALPHCASLAVPCAVPWTGPGAPCSPGQGTAVLPAPKGRSCNSPSPAEPPAWADTSLAAAGTICTEIAAFSSAMSTPGGTHVWGSAGALRSPSWELGARSPQSPGMHGRGGHPGEPRVERSSGSAWLAVQAQGQALPLLLSAAPAARHGCPRAATQGVSTWENHRQPQMLWGKCWGAALPVVGDPSPAQGWGCVSASLLLPQSVPGCPQRRLRRPRERGSCAPGAASPRPPPLCPGPPLRVCKETRRGSLEMWTRAGGASCHGEKPSWEPTSCVGPELIFAVAGGTMAQPRQPVRPSLPYHSHICSGCGAGHAAPRPAAPKAPGQPWPNMRVALPSRSAARSSSVRGSAGA